MNKEYNISGKFIGNIDDLSSNNVVIEKTDGDATGGNWSAVRTNEGDATAGDCSAVRTFRGDATAGDCSAVRTSYGDATGGSWSAVRTYEGRVSVGNRSVGIGSELGSIGLDSVVALVDANGIHKIIIKKEKDKNIMLEVIEE